MPLTKGRLRIVPAAALVAAVLFPGGALAQERAQEKQKVPEPTGITVQGYGQVRAAPDIAYVVATITRRAATQSAADSAVSEQRAKLTAAVREAGLTEKDVSAANPFGGQAFVGGGMAGGGSFGEGGSFGGGGGRAFYRARQNPGGGGGIGQPGINRASFQAQSTLYLTVRKVADAAKVVAAAQGAGNRIEGVLFALADPTQARNQALQKAVADGDGKARAMAQAAKITRIRLVSLTEGFAQPPSPVGVAAMEAAGPAAITATAFVTLRYAITNP